jgi:small subunit ribosomal protein S8
VQALWPSARLYQEVPDVPDLLQGIGRDGTDSRRGEGELVTGVDMSWSDPIADMLTRVRNAYRSGQDVAEMPHSKVKGEIVRVLKKEGYISDYAVEGNNGRTLRVYLKYVGERESAIRGLRRNSAPGRRQYVTWDKIPRVLGGAGLAIISTSLGIMSDREARKRKIGGEIICSAW